MLETELKAMLTESLYSSVKKAYRWDSEVLQKNFYYQDHSGILSSNRSVFRIRQKNGCFKIQVKVHKNAGSPLQICEEFEFDIDNAPDIISAEEAFKYTGLKTGELYKTGFNETLRNSYMWNKTTEICLDKTAYFDIVDYEIEVEYTNELPQAVLDELSGMGISFSEKSVGKYSRFIKRFLELEEK